MRFYLTDHIHSFDADTLKLYSYLVQDKENDLVEEEIDRMFIVHSKF